MAPHRALRITVLLLLIALATVSLPHTTAAAAATPDPEMRDLYERYSRQVMAAFDSSRGGFFGRDGAPSEGAIELMLLRGREGDALALQRARYSLRAMHALLDTVGGGTVNSARDLGTDRTSLEKSTTLNSRRLEVMVRARAWGDDPQLRRDERALIDFFERQLVDPRGGFFIGPIGSRDLEPESNGLALQAWWRLAVADDDAKRRDHAWRSLDRVWNNCRDEDLGMVRRDVWGTIHDPSLLPDQVEVGRAALFAWQAAGRDSDLVRAKALAAHLRLRFEDTKRGGYREEYAYERFGHARRPRRPQDDNARAARFMAELGGAVGDTALVASARRAVMAFAISDGRPRLEVADWALAARATWAVEPLPRSRWGAAEAKAPGKGGAKSQGKRPAGKGRGAKR